MKFVSTFLADGMKGAIQEEYVWIGEYMGDFPNGFFHFYSPDIDSIDVIHKRKFHAEDIIKNIIQKIWANSNVHVTVKKISTSYIGDDYARK